jgi:hypothetical protein
MSITKKTYAYCKQNDKEGREHSSCILKHMHAHREKKWG